MSPRHRLPLHLAAAALGFAFPAASTAATAPAAGPPCSLSPDPLPFVAPGHPFHTVHTALDLDLDLDARTIAGSVTHTMTSLRNGLTEIGLNCVGLSVEKVTVDGQPADYEYPVPGDQSTSWFQTVAATTAGDRLVIRLPHALAAGDTFTVAVSYHGSPQEGLYWIRPEKGLSERPEVWSQGEGEDNRYWIPCHDYPDDRGSFEGTFRVKEGIYVLSNGSLVSTRTAGGKTEYTWRLAEPIPSYLIMVAASSYQVVTDDTGRVPLLYVVPPGTDRATVDRGYGKTGDMIDFFEKETGIAYPWEKYAQVSVQDFIWGGMENASATTMNMRTLHDAVGELTRSNQDLVSHELAHQWWGDLVTCRGWSHMWLNEGFASYYESLYRGHTDGPDAFFYDFYERETRTVDQDNKDPRPLVTQFFNRKDAQNSNNVYSKGSWVLHMLNYLLGDDAFRAVIHHYGEKFRFGLASTQDLSRAVQDVTGENLDWFFEEWAYLAGHPKYKVTKSWDRDAKLLRLTVEQTQEVGGLVPLFRMPVDVEAVCDGSTRTFRIMVDRAEQDFYFSLPSRPRMVIFDKGDRILKELDFAKPASELVYQIDHGDAVARVRAAVDLGKAGADTSAVNALRRALLGDAGYGVRREAALALGKVATEPARDALIAGTKAADAKVRMSCAEAMGGLDKDETAAGVLFALLKTDPAYGVREQAVRSLVAMKSSRAPAACREALTQDSDQDIVRVAGLDGLAKLDDTGALDLVKRMAGPGNPRTYRHAAITDYAKLSAELPDQGARTRAADFLAGMLDDWFLRTRRTVISALGTLGEKSAVPALRREATVDPIESLRDQATRTADAVETGSGPAPDQRALEGEIKDLREMIQGLQHDVDTVKKKVPEKSQEGEN